LDQNVVCLIELAGEDSSMMQFRYLLPLSFLFLLSFEKSKGGIEFDDPDKQKYLFKKRASQIDPRAKEHPEINFVFADVKGNPKDIQHAMVDTRVTPRGKLVIWLMSYRTELFDRTTSFGYHSIQVHYANGWFSKVSKQVGKGTGIGGVRLEAATGEDHSPLVDIPGPDGMEQRAFRFVKWLAQENPQGMWQYFFDKSGKAIDWEKVIICGSSHGSTTSARFAKHRKVARVVMFCGPRDQYETWQALPSKTPVERYFAFSHVLDGGWTGNHYCRSWQMLGLHQCGPIVNVDKTPYPFGNSRRLITDADVKKDSKRAHSMVTPGKASAKNENGKFSHEKVWSYLFTHPVDEVGKPTPIDPNCVVKSQ
jgi:hypothetical protein